MCKYVINHVTTIVFRVKKVFSMVGKQFDFLDICYKKVNIAIYEPRSEKTGLRGFRPGPTQTGL